MFDQCSHGGKKGDVICQNGAERERYHKKRQVRVNANRNIWGRKIQEARHNRGSHSKGRKEGVKIPPSKEDHPNAGATRLFGLSKYRLRHQADIVSHLWHAVLSCLRLDYSDLRFQTTVQLIGTVHDSIERTEKFPLYSYSFSGIVPHVIDWGQSIF